MWNGVNELNAQPDTELQRRSSQPVNDSGKNSTEKLTTNNYT